MDDIDKQYDEVTEWMFRQIPMFQNLGSDAYKPGLERVNALSEAFGSPHLKLNTVHVGGTNGKGSTSSLLASVLTEHGHGHTKIGLFTSPHLIDFRERIRINGQMINKADVVGFIGRYRALNLGIEPSFFELTTVMAFDWFVRMGVDLAVIEVGLGGRLDSTNIITPQLSIITNISLDHTALLGDTPEKIAYEKAGIIKPGVPAVVGRAEGGVEQVFCEKAHAVGASIVFAYDNPAFESVDYTADANTYINTLWGTVASPLTGTCQSENANTVFNALQLLPYHFTENDIRQGFANVYKNSGLMGRWTVVGTEPTVVCDTGHNPGGWEYLGPRLRDIGKRIPLRLVIGFVNDKDISTILRMMPHNAEYFFTSPDVKRGRPASSLQAEAAAHGLTGNTYPSVAEAFKAAMRDFPAEGTIFVGGSTFVVADLLKHLTTSSR